MTETSRKCRARAKLDIERPHFCATKTKNGDVVWGVKKRIKRSFFCLKEKGHDGPHHDPNEMVQWSGSPE